MVDCCDNPGAPVRVRRKGAIEPGRDADIVPVRSGCATTRSGPADLHHTSDYTPYEGMEAVGGGARRLRSAGVRVSAMARSSASAGSASSSNAPTREPARQVWIASAAPGLVLLLVAFAVIVLVVQFTGTH
jgi:hypothetical protein